MRGGVDIVQLRDKNGEVRTMAEFSRRLQKSLRGRALYIINDRVDLALALETDGVHLGQEDLSVAFARRFLGKKFVIGKSCQTAPHVHLAAREGADYIGFGSIFKTKTKPERKPMDPDLLTQALKKAKIPVFAIGGITVKNLQGLVDCGVKRAAVCRAIISARDPYRETQKLKTLLDMVR